MEKIEMENLDINPSIEIGKNWMLITAGNENQYNTMTASWGSLGSLWENGLTGKGTFTIYVKPSRYTHRFIEENEYFSICFFDDIYKKDLMYLGSKSGRDENKIDKTNLNIDFIENVPFFKEAKLIFICKKIYEGKILKEGFIDKKILDKYYKESDDESFHDVYIGDIISIYEN